MSSVVHITSGGGTVPPKDKKGGFSLGGFFKSSPAVLAVTTIDTTAPGGSTYGGGGAISSPSYGKSPRKRSPRKAPYEIRKSSTSRPMAVSTDSDDFNPRGASSGVKSPKKGTFDEFVSRGESKSGIKSPSRSPRKKSRATSKSSIKVSKITSATI